MKSLALVLALAACQSKSSPPAATGSAAPAPAVTGSAAAVSGSATPSAVGRRAEICEDSLGMLARASCPNNEAGLRAAKTSFEGLINTMTKLGDGDPTSYDITCARILLALERDLQAGSGHAGSAACALPIDAELRAKVQRTLDAYYNNRVAVTKTGDAASDDAIAKLAALRDAACDCRTSSCIDALDKRLTELPPLPATAPQAAKDLAGKLLNNSAVCAERARMNP